MIPHWMQPFSPFLKPPTLEQPVTKNALIAHCQYTNGNFSNDGAIAEQHPANSEEWKNISPLSTT
jgi:hypothetical protein